jgi:hypothetical protein
MVHVFCLDKSCKRIIHLDDSEYWNFKGKIKCQQCNREMLIEIREGKLVSAVEIERK